MSPTTGVYSVLRTSAKSSVSDDHSRVGRTDAAVAAPCVAGTVRGEELLMVEGFSATPLREAERQTRKENWHEQQRLARREAVYEHRFVNGVKFAIFETR